MKRFSFKTRMIYFGAITVVSIAFFALQLYSNSLSEEPSGIGSTVLLVLWGVMAVFGLAGIVYSISKRDRH